MSNKNNVSGYIDYHRQLAVSHKDIRHDPESETGNSAPGAKKFTRFSSDEVVEGLRTKVGFPCYCLEMYENSLEAESVLNINQKPKGAFMIVDHPANDSYAAQEDCYAKCEQIMIELLQKIWVDHYGEDVDPCTRPFKEINFGTVNIVPVGPVFENEFGYRVEYDFEFQQTINISSPPEDGTFI